MQPEDKKDPVRENLSLSGLVDIKEWQGIQDKFAAIANVGLRTIDMEGNFITSPSGMPNLCNTVIKETFLKDEICDMCLPTFLGGKAIVDRNLSFICYPGLHNFLAPLKLGDKVFGYVIVGPLILVMRQSKEQYRQAANELGIELNELWNAILELKVISFHGAQSLVEFIKDMGEYILKLSYQNLTMEKGIAVQEIANLGRLLEALLDVAFQVTGADLGSIMLIDNNKGELTIQASKGIPDEIAAKTRVRLGDGISGIAAKEGEQFLIDNNTQDNRIKKYLGRPYINSSMVVPIKVRNRVLGVMNLGALKTSDVKFNSGNLQLVNRLVDLATVAFGD